MTITTRHTYLTRILHGLLAVAIIVQLGSSLGMSPAEDGHAGNTLFGAHEVAGLASFALVLAFWIWAMLRRVGTPLGVLFPWLSAARLSALWGDSLHHLKMLGRLRMPEHQHDGPLAGAIHGLGLSLVTVMAATGTYYYFSGAESPEAAGLPMLIHVTLGNLVWVYLLGHAAMGLLAHLATGFDLRSMWSLSARVRRN
jgi:cytochrome b561